MIRVILTHPHPLLRQVAQVVPLAEITQSDFQKLLEDMIETMYLAKGIGLAAPQINVSRRILVAETAEDGRRQPLVLINPEIISRSWRKVQSEEGCLSVPDVYGIVKRSRAVKVKGYDRNGKLITISSNKLLAIILQHEIDHLDGILFIDKALKVNPISEHEPRI